MTTFDATEVRAFAADLDARMDRCDNGEGTECATLDASLHHYADLCCSYIEAVRAWGRAVFRGQVAFDAEAERVLRDEGARLRTRAKTLCARGRRAEGPCYDLEVQRSLQAALWDLDRLLDGWVSPARAVGPLARQGLTMNEAAIEAASRRVASLPPLPADWQPSELRVL